MQNNVPPALAKSIDISALHTGVNHIEIIVDEAARKEIAKRLKVPAVSALKGDFDIRKIVGGIDVKMKIGALVERVCIASLEPMTETVAAEYSLHLLRDFDDREDADEREDDDLVSFEPLEGETLDLGELLIQHLALSLDPYPRKADARSLAADFGSDRTSSPFEALKGLVDDAS
ncbi:MAG: YceD family protein [Parvularculaceae bacterium]